jgi:tRNA(adenine34) deaminase
MMRLALDEAKSALHLGEVPIGAVLTRDHEIIASGFNQPIHSQDPTAHAEIVALRKAARALENYRLPRTTLYVTIEPCLMCIGAIVQARVGSLVYGAPEPKFGAVESLIDLDEVDIPHRLSVKSGVLAAECGQLLTEFFRFRRENL